MRSRVQKWGNSLALRIPRSLAVEAGIENGTAVELTCKDGHVIVTPIAQPAYRLDELLARVTPANRHAEADFGPRQGDEIW